MVTKVEIKLASSRKCRARNWTDMEVNLFATILVDERYNFAASLENLNAQKTSNKEAFVHIKEIFDQSLNDADFKGNILLKYFHTDDGLTNFEPLDTSADKLRKKYNNLKAEWRKRTEQSKRVGGIYLDREPRWFVLLNPIFSLASEATTSVYHPMTLLYTTDEKTYYPIENNHTQSIYQSESKYQFIQCTASEKKITAAEKKEYCSMKTPVVSTPMVEYVEEVDEGEEDTPEAEPMKNAQIQMREPPALHTTTQQAKYHSTTIINTFPKGDASQEKSEAELVGDGGDRSTAAHRKRTNHVKSSHLARTVKHSQKRTNNRLTKSVHNLAASLLELKKVSLENEARRDEMFLKFFAEEAEKNRAHDIRLAELYHTYTFQSYSRPLMSPVPMTTLVNTLPKTCRRPQMYNRNECLVPKHIVENPECGTSSSTPRIDSFYSVPQEKDSI